MTVCKTCGDTSGTFRLVGDEWVHVKCSKAHIYHRKPVFPLTTYNIGDPNDGPITVQSMRHLRQLESAHGVHSEVFNNDVSYQGERY